MAITLARRAALTGAIVVAALAGGGARAQPAPIDPITNGELIRMQSPFQPIQPAPDTLKRWEAEPRWSFGPFDESRVGFRLMTLTLERIPFDCDTGLAGKRALAHVIVAAQRAGGTTYWELSEPFPDAGRDPCDRDTDTSWSVIDLNREPPSAGPATSDPTIPIFRVAYTATWSGRTSAGTSQQLIIDVRTQRPVLAARFSSLALDGFCAFAHERPAATCEWDGQRQDFVCTESFRDARRYVSMMSGERLPRPPDSRSPRDLAGFVDTLVSSPKAVGTWAEPADVGAVRLIAEIPGKEPGRRIFLFGASDQLGAPFVLAVREKNRTRVVPVKVDSASGRFNFSSGLTDDPSVPLAEYRLSGEPPAFKVRGLTQDSRGTRLVGVVTEFKDSGLRSLSHIAIEEIGDTVVAHAIRVASSSKDPDEAFLIINTDEALDVCEHGAGGFAAPAKIRLAPLRIDYDVEPSFEIVREGPERSASMCVVASHAAWQSGKGFALEYESAACSASQFRAVHVRPDGSLDVRKHTRKSRPR